MAGHKYAYYVMLRALGAWLDEEAPKRFTVMETVDGFTVILTHESPGRPDLYEAHFDYDALVQREKRLVEKRRILGSPFGSGAGKQWSLAPTGRQDFLRALGYELDDAEGSSIILDELDDQLILTYSFIEPGQGYLWHKKMLRLQREEIAKILDVARDRRRLERRRGLFRR